MRQIRTLGAGPHAEMTWQVSARCGHTQSSHEQTPMAGSSMWQRPQVVMSVACSVTRPHVEQGGIANISSAVACLLYETRASGSVASAARCSACLAGSPSG
jgi:hypothetical protein